MEGMAEWTAQHWESQGEMVLRDAVLNDQVIPLNMLESFDHFEQVYMAYKESQSIFSVTVGACLISKAKSFNFL